MRNRTHKTKGEPTVGRILKDARTAHGDTQAKLSKYLGHTSPQFVSNIERGIAPMPPETIKKIGRRYGEEATERLAKAKRKDFSDGLAKALE